MMGTASTRELHYLAKEELFRNPFLRWLIRAHNAIPLRRAALSTAALKEAISIVKNGGAVLIFPEGTRSKIGRLLPPRPGVGLLVSATDAPVLPACIMNSNRAVSCILRRERAAIRFGRSFRVGDLKLSGTRRENYREVGEEVMRRISEQQEWLSKTLAR
jgi:1-acyl-sn-glycerol-3-phosphate acyltransferase